MLPPPDDIRLGIIGLGYVGLPLAVAFGEQLPTLGFDIDRRRVDELAAGRDRTLEVDVAELEAARNLAFSSDPALLAGCNVFVVTVPTPVDLHKRPDLQSMERASETVGAALKRGGMVIYESTVYPGATEGVCVPILERTSGLACNSDFLVGYSPERINPGDREHRLASITKLTSGSTPEAAEFVDRLYRRIIPAGTHRVSSIRVAEAAKVIENTQRDVNIALVNELAMIFNRLGVDTEEVLIAAGTKWNFLPFRPGLVGGHCIGVDPYYLTHKSQEIGYHPEMILAGRRINDNMGSYVAGEVARLMIRRRIHLMGARVLLLGFAFKENCPDARNTGVAEVVRGLGSYGALVEVHDPWIDATVAERLYGITIVSDLERDRYDAVIIAVAHRQFREMGVAAIRALGKPDHVLYDIKHVFAAGETDGRL